jgi:hypothetical protein
MRGTSANRPCAKMRSDDLGSNEREPVRLAELRTIEDEAPSLAGRLSHENP